MELHAFGLTLAGVTFAHALADVALLAVAWRHVRPRSHRAAVLLAVAASLDLLLVLTCCLRLEASGAAMEWALTHAMTDASRLAALDVLAIGTPVTRTVQVLAVAAAVLALSRSRSAAPPPEAPPSRTAQAAVMSPSGKETPTMS